MSKASIMLLPAGLLLIVAALALIAPHHEGGLPPDWQPVLPSGDQEAQGHMTRALSDAEGSQRQSPSQPQQLAQPQPSEEPSPPAAAAAAPHVEAQVAPLIDLNAATAEQLTALPGIGPSKAAAVVDYRSKTGGFRSKEQLMEVKGIGPKTYEKLKDSIIVQ